MHGHTNVKCTLQKYVIPTEESWIFLYEISRIKVMVCMEAFKVEGKTQ